VTRPPYAVAHLSEIAPTPAAEIPGEWRQVRHHFGITEFSANAFTATAAGEEIVHEHMETPNDGAAGPGAEELYVVLAGRAVVRLDDERVEAGPGTLVFVGEPATVRSFTALEPGTTVLAVGTNPGVRFVVSQFERERTPR
jgi:mannose-6-phosphate isomerase-like protein (cupin superfamily)